MRTGDIRGNAQTAPCIGAEFDGPTLHPETIRSRGPQGAFADERDGDIDLRRLRGLRLLRT
jgi:hypothetical protein